MWLQEGDNVYGDSISVIRRIYTGWKRGFSENFGVNFTWENCVGVLGKSETF